jgi:hypothetical protein
MRQTRRWGKPSLFVLTVEEGSIDDDASYAQGDDEPTPTEDLAKVWRASASWTAASTSASAIGCLCSLSEEPANRPLQQAQGFSTEGPWGQYTRIYYSRQH